MLPMPRNYDPSLLSCSPLDTADVRAFLLSWTRLGIIASDMLCHLGASKAD